jgi:hypothetical protein
MRERRVQIAISARDLAHRHPRQPCRLPRGEYHIVMVTDFPDDDTAAAAVLALASLGYVHTKTMRAFTEGK